MASSVALYGYFCKFKHLEAEAAPGWSFAELRNEGDVRGIPTTNRQACYRWRDGACRFGNSCRNAHFRPAWAHDNAPPPATSQPARPSEPADASQSQWPPLSSQGGNSQALPSKWPAPAQPTGNTVPPVRCLFSHDTSRVCCSVCGSVDHIQEECLCNGGGSYSLIPTRLKKRNEQLLEIEPLHHALGRLNLRILHLRQYGTSNSWSSWPHKRSNIWYGTDDEEQEEWVEPEPIGAGGSNHRVPPKCHELVQGSVQGPTAAANARHHR